MAKFVLMLPHAPDRYTNLGEAEFMDLMKDYIGWVEEMSANKIAVFIALETEFAAIDHALRALIDA